MRVDRIPDRVESDDRPRRNLGQGRRGVDVAHDRSGIQRAGLVDDRDLCDPVRGETDQLPDEDIAQSRGGGECPRGRRAACAPRRGRGAQ